MRKQKREFECANSQDSFCYVCGEYVLHKNAQTFTYLIKENYLQYFGFPAVNVDQKWAPSIICISCKRNLNGWASGSAGYVFTDILSIRLI